VSQHGIEFMEVFHLAFDLLNRDAHFPGHFLLVLGFMGHKFMEWRIQQPYRDRQVMHGLEYAFEVSTLDRQ